LLGLLDDEPPTSGSESVEHGLELLSEILLREPGGVHQSQLPSAAQLLIEAREEVGGGAIYTCVEVLHEELLAGQLDHDWVAARA